MEGSQTLSLRERQKEGRRARIIAAAKSLFVEAGLGNITIEAIAEIAGVSSVTVHNYYGTKSGVLLALVAESDRELLETLDEDLSHQPKDSIDLLLRFFTIVCDHTLTHLDKSVWRQVISASVDGDEPRFNKLYRELDYRLASVLIREIELLKAAGKLSESANSTHLGWAMFNLQNARFVEFIANDSKTRDQALHDLRNDLLALSTLVHS
ncbi:TetR/AcrR family transcriptional regulator [Antarcticimicrobium sediminis]|uniref:TetR/AcrR family transcriptional regulator n=1 Tax=Antarcticimicrobium sediminis TaxID=2546227 RepID=A0A4V2Z720_9RHOB|nr:TetR/AcrR family transcriptional regulator [Antarcticimicrobium sediminis]